MHKNDFLAIFWAPFIYAHHTEWGVDIAAAWKYIRWVRESGCDLRNNVREERFPWRGDDYLLIPSPGAGRYRDKRRYSNDRCEGYVSSCEQRCCPAGSNKNGHTMFKVVFCCWTKGCFSLQDLLLVKMTKIYFTYLCPMRIEGSAALNIGR